MQTIKEMSTERLCSELDAAIARLKADRTKLRDLLQRLIPKNIQEVSCQPPLVSPVTKKIPTAAIRKFCHALCPRDDLGIVGKCC
jgi:hypothetical protein